MILRPRDAGRSVKEDKYTKDPGFLSELNQVYQSLTSEGPRLTSRAESHKGVITCGGPFVCLEDKQTNGTTHLLCCCEEEGELVIQPILPSPTPPKLRQYMEGLLLPSLSSLSELMSKSDNSNFFKREKKYVFG